MSIGQRLQQIICLPWITLVCAIILIFTLKRSWSQYEQKEVMDVYRSVRSASQESIEVVLCPMPRLHSGLFMHKDKYIKHYLNFRFFHEVFEPWLNLKKSPYQEYTKVITKCLVDKTRAFSPIESLTKLKELINEDSKFRSCSPFKGDQQEEKEQYREDISLIIENPSRKKINETFNDFHDKMTAFIRNMYDLSDERFVEEYTEIFESVWVLQRQNVTFSRWLNDTGVDFLQHLQGQAHNLSENDPARPKQKLNLQTVATRIAPRCVRQVLAAAAEPAFQQSRIIFPFENNCSTEPNGTWPRGSLCLSSADMYVSVYVYAQNSFTDIPLAGENIPFRVPIDRQTRVNIVIERRDVPDSDCDSRQKTYPQKYANRVDCVERCVLQAGLRNVPCILPWLHRIANRFEPYSRERLLHECNDTDELKTTIKKMRTVFDVEQRRCPCPQNCEQLIIETHLTGSITTSDGTDSYLELTFMDTMDVYGQERLYSTIQLTSEIMGNVSFFLGISLLGVYDWLIGVFLWAIGKIPFIPALPPLLKKEVYSDEVCASCLGVERGARSSSDSSSSDNDDNQAYLRKQYRRKRATNMKEPKKKNKWKISRQGQYDIEEEKRKNIFGRMFNVLQDMAESSDSE